MRPAASVRHFLFQSVSVPAGGARLTLRCEVDRFDGQVTFCDTPEPQGRLEIRASWLAKFYQFALPQNVRLGPGRLAVEIDEHIQPIDPAPPITAPAPVDAQARFDRRPSSEELANLYPLVERHRGREATVSMDCEVMGDLTLFCINPIVAGMNLTQSNTLQFQLAALQVSSLFRASPQFGNGIQARGTRFYLSVPFRVASSGTPTGEESRQPGLQD